MNTTAFRISFLLLFLLLSRESFVVLGQTNMESVYKLEDAADLYDEHGYTKGKSVSVSGNLSVSNSNGNLNYVQPISSYALSGHNINISLNYCGSATFSTYDAVGAISGTTANEQWTKMTTNKPLWSLCINNFVVQALAQNNEYIIDGGGKKLSTILQYNPVKTVYEQGKNEIEPGNWVIEGYDVCTPVTTRQTQFNITSSIQLTDKIYILRGDGSILELCKIPNLNSSNVDESQFYQNWSSFSGRYFERGTNAKGYAIVEHDTTLISEDLLNYFRSDAGHFNTTATVKFRKHLKGVYVPRRVRYYPGDGLEYYFYEHIVPFGVNNLGPLAGDGFRYGRLKEAPRQFYLESINTDCMQIAGLAYTDLRMHSSLDNSEENELFRRGRIPVSQIGEVVVTYSNSGLSLSTPDGKYRVYLNGNNVEFGTYPDLEALRIHSKASNVYSVSKIIKEVDADVERVYSFTYDNKRRIYEDFKWISKLDPPQTFNTHTDYKRLASIKEPSLITKIEYYDPVPNNPLITVVKNQENGATTPDDNMNMYNVNDIVHKVTKYSLLSETNEPKLNEDEYFFPGCQTYTINGNGFYNQGSLGAWVGKRAWNNTGNPAPTMYRKWITACSTIIYPQVVGKEQQAETVAPPTQHILKEYEYERISWQNKLPGMAQHFDVLNFTVTNLLRTSVTTKNISLLHELQDPNLAIPEKEVTETTYGLFKYNSNGSPSPTNYIIVDANNYVNQLQGGDFAALSLPVRKKVIITLGQGQNTSSLLKNAFSYKYNFAKTKDYVASENKLDAHSLVYGYGILREFARTHNPSTVSTTLPLEQDNGSVLTTNLTEYLTIPIVKREDLVRKRFDQQNIKNDYIKLKLSINSTNEDFREYADNFVNLIANPDHVVQSGYLCYSTGLPQRSILFVGAITSYSNMISGGGNRYATEYLSDIINIHTSKYIVNKDRNLILADTVFGRGLPNNTFPSFVNNTYEYNSSNTPMPNRVSKSKNVLGSEQHYLYSLFKQTPIQWSDKPKEVGAGSNNFWYIKNELLNDNSIRTSRIDPNSLKEASRDFTAGDAKAVRFYNPPINQNENFYLSNLYKRNDQGYIVGRIDENNWYHQAEFDKLGRVKFIREPYDFPVLPSITEYSNQTWKRKPYIAYTTESYTQCFAGRNTQTQLDYQEQRNITEHYEHPLTVFRDYIEFLEQNTGCPQYVWSAHQNKELKGRKMNVRKGVTLHFEKDNTVSSLSQAKFKIKIEKTDKCNTVEFKTQNSTGQELKIRTFVFGCDDIRSATNNGENLADKTNDAYKGLVSESPNLAAYYNRTLEFVLNENEKQALLNDGIYILIESKSFGLSTEFSANDLSVDIDDKNINYSSIPHLELTGVKRKEINTNDYTAKFSFYDHVMERRGNVRLKLDDVLHTQSDFGDDGTINDNIRQVISQHQSRTDGFVFRSFVNTVPFYSTSNEPGALVNSNSGWKQIKKLGNGGGNTVRVTDEENNDTKTYYDHKGRVSKTFLSDGKKVVNEYEFGGLGSFNNVASMFADNCYGFVRKERSYVVFPPSNMPTELIAEKYYDAFDRLRLERTFNSVKNTDLLTKYNYDNAGQLIEVINPENQKTWYWFDEYNRIQYKYHPDMGVISYRYDKLGNVRFTQTEKQAQEHKVTFYEYDDLNRPTFVGEAKIDITTVAQPYGYQAFNPLPGTSRPSVFPFTRLTDKLNSDVLNNNEANGILTVNKTLWTTPVVSMPNTLQGIVPTGICDAPGAYFKEDRSTERNTPTMNTHAFWATLLPTNTSITNTISPANSFENIAQYSFNTRTATVYDQLPPTIRQGAIWEKCPSQSVWNALTPNGQFRNLKGKPSAIAYRDHQDDALNYIMFSYDERGRLEAQIRYTDNIGWDAIYYRYNSMNKVISVVVADAERQHCTWYGYDYAGRLDTTWSRLGAPGTGLLNKQPTGNTWQYRAALTFKRKGSGNNAEVVQNYTPRDMVSSIKYPAIDLNTSYTYNTRGWIYTMTSGITGQPALFDQEYTYDQYGNISNLHWKRNNFNYFDFENQYDQFNRLKQFKYVVPPATYAKTEVYAYDNIGNRESVITTDMNSDTYETTTLYQMGTSRLLEYFTKRTSVTPNKTELKHLFTYNPDGSLKTRYRVEELNRGYEYYKRTSETFDYTYNSLIHQYTSNTTYSDYSECFDHNYNTELTWLYRYAPSGEREQKRLKALPFTNSGYPYSLNRTYYLIGPGNRQHANYEGRENTFNGECTVTGRATIWAPSEYLMYAGGENPFVTFLPHGGKEYKILDHLGNTRTIVNQSGGIESESDYEPFGKRLTIPPQYTLTSNTNVPKQGFVGKELDSESDLADHGVRKYDYITGRFMAVDPLWEQYNGLTSYNYSANNPLVLFDPNGFATYYYNGELYADDKDESTKDVVYAVQEEAMIQEVKDKEGKIDFEKLKEYSYKLPSESIRAEIYEKIYKEGVKPGRKDIETGGAVGVNKKGEEYLVEGGTVVVSGDATSTAAVQKAVQQIRTTDRNTVIYTVHTHPYNTYPIPSPGDRSGDFLGIVLNNLGVQVHGKYESSIAIVPLFLFSGAKKSK